MKALSCLEDDLQGDDVQVLIPRVTIPEVQSRRSSAGFRCIESNDSTRLKMLNRGMDASAARRPIQKWSSKTISEQKSGGGFRARTPR